MKILVGFVFLHLAFIGHLNALKHTNRENLSLNSSFNHYNSGRKLKSVDWCSLNCDSDKHIGCETGGDCKKPESPCEFIKLNPSKVVEAINKIRDKFALGNDPRAEGIQVADMMALRWDDDLAFLAGCNLKSCPASMTHDHCHRTKKFDSAGQNIAWSSGVKPCDPQYLYFQESWYEEITLVKPGQLKELAAKFESVKGQGIGHFTQSIWSETSHIGCAMTSKEAECMMTCNYAPAGNFIGRSMFKLGAPASACPAGVKPNKQLLGLCGSGGISTRVLDGNHAGVPGKVLSTFFILCVHLLLQKNIFL